MLVKSLFNFFSKDIAMDLGTANTLLFARGKGLVINEPSVVSIDTEKNSIVAIGSDAKPFLGRTPYHIRTIRPMKEGVIADFDMTRVMISHFVKKVITGLRLAKPSMVICIPTGITQVEKRAVIDSALLAGAREVSLVEEPMAAAIGAKMPITEPLGNLVLDIGGGTSEVAVISLSAIAASSSIRVAGDAMTSAIQRYMKEIFRLEVGENTAENVKKLIGTAMPIGDIPALEVSGKDAVHGTPKVITVTDGHIREALKEPVQLILTTVFQALEKTPPELSADIYRTGMLMAGGGSLLKGLDTYIGKAINLKVVVDDEPLTTVLRGTAACMMDRKTYKDVFIN